MPVLRNIAILAIAAAMLGGCIGVSGKLCLPPRDCACGKFPDSYQGNCATGPY